MASLTSLSLGESLLLRAYGTDNSDEKWLLLQLEMNSPMMRVRTTGSFLTCTEVQQLIEGIFSVVRGREVEFVFQPLEPYFMCSIKGIQQSHSASVAVRFREDVAENEEKVLLFQASNSQLLAFASDLETELKKILAK